MNPSRTAPAKGASARASGFTLVEMLVVLAIVGLVAAVATPWIRQMSRRAALRSAASQIQTTLLAARMRAVKRNLPASVLVVTAAAGGNHELDTIEADPPPPAPTPLPATRLAISSDALAFVTLPAANKITFDGSGRRVAPAGSVPSDIVFEGPTASAVRNQITIRTSVTGKIEVVTPAVWQ